MTPTGHVLTGDTKQKMDNAVLKLSDVKLTVFFHLTCELVLLNNVPIHRVHWKSFEYECSSIIRLPFLEYYGQPKIAMDWVLPKMYIDDPNMLTVTIKRSLVSS